MKLYPISLDINNKPDYADLNKRKEKLQKIADLPLVGLIRNGKIEKAKEEISLCI